MSVKRYDCAGGGIGSYCQGCYHMAEVPNGDWVAHDDYASIAAELEAEQSRHADTLQHNADIGTALTECRIELAACREQNEKLIDAQSREGRHALRVENERLRAACERKDGLLRETRGEFIDWLVVNRPELVTRIDAELWEQPCRYSEYPSQCPDPRCDAAGKCLKEQP